MKNTYNKSEVQERYVTHQDVEVTKRITNGRTFLFTGENSKQNAENKATKLRTYCYEIYQLIKGRKYFAGYAVPK